MLFVSFRFWAILLPLCVLLYFVLGKTARGQNIVLLIASVIFYASYDLKYLLILALSIAVTYIGGRLGSKQADKSKADKIYVWALVLNLLILVVFKYTNFLLGNLNLLLGLFGVQIAMPSILLPVGLAFYTLQSSTYLLDLKNGKAEPEYDIINYSLFVSFFPTITSGPILRAASFLPQIRKRREITWERFQIFVFTFLWGAFLKLVLADRLSLFVSNVFGGYYNYGGFVLIVHMCAATLHLYFDFVSYSFMAIALGALFGFDIPENFRQPWFATSYPEVWRRWHVSLTSWFREYLYFPLGGSRKGERRKILNTFIVFTVSGLWHGAAWTFVLWGFLNALFIAVGEMTRPWRVKLCNKLHINRESFGNKMLQRFVVFLLMAAAFTPFFMGGLRKTFVYFRQMFTVWNPWTLFDGTLSTLGMTGTDWTICLFSGVLALLVSALREHGYGPQVIVRQNALCKAALLLGVVFAIAVFGVYGAQYSATAFMYAGF